MWRAQPGFDAGGGSYNSRMKTIDELLAVQKLHPLSARWFSLGAMLLDYGYEIENYSEDYFFAELTVSDTGIVKEAMEVELLEDGRALWTFSSPFATEAGGENDFEELEKETNYSAGWWDVEADLCKLWEGDV